MIFTIGEDDCSPQQMEPRRKNAATSRPKPNGKTVSTAADKHLKEAVHCTKGHFDWRKDPLMLVSVQLGARSGRLVEPSMNAIVRANSATDSTHIFCMIFARCAFTVRSAIRKVVAICLFRRPFMTSSSTCFSRRLKWFS